MTVTANNSAADAAAVEMVTLTIDDVEVSVPKGTLIIRAAEQIGTAIPRFCDHPLLKPAGACRQCLVEVAMPDREGVVRPMPKPQASCTMEVGPGMVVKTQVTSEVADKAQRGVMELLLINHPLDCPVCDKGGECPLQNQAMSNGQATSRFEEKKRTFAKPINVSTQVLLDRERCVLCQRCTRFSKEIAGDPFIDLQMRGAKQQIGTFDSEVLDFAGKTGTVGGAELDETGKPFSSYFSGNTVQICPVGALTGAAYRFRSRPFDLRSVPSACEHCASGCDQRTDIRRDVVLRRMAGNDPQVNEEWNCDKGRWAFASTTLNDRITTPMIRRGGKLEQVSWPEALAAAAEGLKKAKNVGVLTGGRLTAEDAYAYSKFARVALGSNDIDFRSRAHSAEEADFLAAVVAGQPMAVTYDDIVNASSVLLVGLEPEEESPMIFLRLKGAGVPVFSVAAWASRGLNKLGATLVQTTPGDEAAIVAEIAKGEGAAGAALAAGGGVILVGERMAAIPGALSAVAAAAATTGAKLAWVPRRAGERGALESGALPNLLPGGRPVADAAARAEVEALWGGSLPAEAGRDTAGILDALKSGALGGAVVAGVEIADLPNPTSAQVALAAAGFLVSVESRTSAVTALANVVLPAAAVTHKSGTFLSWEGRGRSFDTAIVSNDLSDVRIADALADAMGTHLGLKAVSAARAELNQLGQFSGKRPAAPKAKAGKAAKPKKGEAVLATWRLLLDAGRGQDGEPYLAGTAQRPVARLSEATAAAAGVATGENLSVSTENGSITLPAMITAMPDGVVWVPQNSPRSAVHDSLGVTAGAVVSIAGSR